MHPSQCSDNLALLLPGPLLFSSFKHPTVECRRVGSNILLHLPSSYINIVRPGIIVYHLGPGPIWQFSQCLINPEYSLKRLMLKLKLQYFGHLMRRVSSLEKTLMLAKIEGRRRRGWQRMRWLDNISDLKDMSLSKLWEIIKDRKSWSAAGSRGCSQTQFSNWTRANTLWLHHWNHFPRDH